MNVSKHIRSFAMAWLVIFSLPLIMGSCTSQPEPADKFIGLQLWSVREAMNADPAGTLAAIGEMGYSFIEAAGYQEGKFYGMEPAAFRELVEANGMVFLASHAGRDLPTEETWDEAMQWWQTAIEAHAAAGVQYITQAWMGPAGYESLEGLQKFCDYFNTVGEMCNAMGIRFGYHNHANEFAELEGEVIYDYMLNNTDPDKVFFQMDLYWVVVGERDPVDYFNRFPGRFLQWHVKDYEEVGASGKIDFERIFTNAENSGVEYIIVEVEEYNYEPIESVRISLEYLKNADYVNF